MSMLITAPEELTRFVSSKRIWQGIPSIEVTKKGRIFATFYSGLIKEEIGNYAVLIKSDQGEDYSEPIAVAYLEEHRCFDPCLWIDPLERLWFTWSICPDDALYGSICEDPDADELVWGEPFKIGHDVMMNKPVVLSTGEWLFPVAVWNHGVRALPPYYDSKTAKKGSFVYKTTDNGKTFFPIGAADVKNRSFDEHMLLELNDGRLMMLVRTYYGIAKAYSSDRGKTWTEGIDSYLTGTSSRFHIRRLRSGRILLVTHDRNTKKREKLTVYLSEDEGKTWPWKLLLDERDFVSYPDAAEGEDGTLYIIYDRERGAYKKTLAEVAACAREILVAKITEEDILHGKLHSDHSYLGRVISKLTGYPECAEQTSKIPLRFSDRAFAELLVKNYQKEDLLNEVFDEYPPRCDCQTGNTSDIDRMIKQFIDDDSTDMNLLTKIITAVRTAFEQGADRTPVCNRITEWVKEHYSSNFTLEEMSESLKISRYYMCHIFRQETGITIMDYRNELRLTNAKQELIRGDKSITDIALQCGFGDSSYFSKSFKASEGITPSEYRELHS